MEFTQQKVFDDNISTRVCWSSSGHYRNYSNWKAVTEQPQTKTWNAVYNCGNDTIGKGFKKWRELWMAELKPTEIKEM